MTAKEGDVATARGCGRDRRENDKTGPGGPMTKSERQIPSLGPAPGTYVKVSDEIS